MNDEEIKKRIGATVTCEQRIRLNLPSYDDAYRRFLEDAFRGTVKDHPILGEIETVRDRHAGPVRNVDGEKPLDQPMMKMGAPFTLKTETVMLTDVDAHTLAVANFATAMVNEMERQSLGNFGAIADAAGNTVSGEGKSTLEALREILRKVDLSFNEDGTMAQTFAVRPENPEVENQIMRYIAHDPEAQSIIAEKRAAWEVTRAARAHRTLSR